MSIAEGLLAGLQQPLGLEGAQLPADMSLYAGGGLDVLKAHEQKYKQQKYLDKQIERNSRRLAKEMAKAYELSGYPEEQEKMSSISNTPFVGSNVHSRRQYLLSKLAEQPNQSIASPAPGTEQPTTEEPAPVEGASPQYRVTGGFGPVHRLQMPPTPPGQVSVNNLPPREMRYNPGTPDPRDKPVPTIQELQAKAGLPEQLRIARGGDPYLSDDMIDVGQPNVYKPAPDPYLSDDMIDVGQPNVYKPAPTPEAPGIMSRIGGGLGRGMNYLEGLGTQAVRQGTYGAQQLANLALRNSDYLSGMVGDDQEARILGNLMQGSVTAGDEAFYGQQLKALRDRVNSPGRTDQQQQVLNTLARTTDHAGNQMPAQARELRNMHLEEQGRMMGIIPEGKAATPEQRAQLEKELGPTYDYFQGTSPEAQQAGVSAFGQPGGFTPISQYLGDAADRVVQDTKKHPLISNAFRRARGALGFEDQVMGGNPTGALAQQYDLGDINNVSEEDIDNQFANLAQGGLSSMQVADNLLNRNMKAPSREGILRALELFDSGDQEAAQAEIHKLSKEEAETVYKIMMAQRRTSSAQ